MNLNLLKKNHTYLIKPSYSSGNVKSITVLVISDKAYKLRWNNNCNDNIEWILKNFLDSDYYFIEDITDIVIPKPEELKFDIVYKVNNFKFRPYFLESESCPFCGGSGQLPDDKSTAGSKICMSCGGCGHKIKRVDIILE